MRLVAAGLAALALPGLILWLTVSCAPQGDPEIATGVADEPDPQAVRDLLLQEIALRLPETARKVLVLGLDGLDWDLVLPWVRDGKMPNLDRLMRAGTWGRMETIVPTLSPLIWTTIATGVAPDIHGILDFVEKEPSRNVMVPITGRGRRVPAIWNLATALDRQVGVVGWWASWPAEKVNGVMVSDRLYYTLTQGIDTAVFRRDPPDLIYPPQRADEFKELRDKALRETDFSAVRYFLDVPEAEYAEAIASEAGMDHPIDGFRRILASSRTYLSSGLRLAADQPDLLMVYLEGTDTIGHLLAPYMPPATVEIDARQAALYAAAVPRYFEVVDRWIGRFLAVCSLTDYAVVLVSDHGFHWSEKRPRGLSGTAGPTAPLWHDQDAAFVIAGAGVENRGHSQAAASIYDVAPTIAALLGLPADSSWTGTPLPGSPPSDLEALDYRSLIPPASYRRGSGAAAPVDPEYLAKLQSLGYISGTLSAGAAARARQAAGDAEPAVGAQPGESATRAELNNLAVLKINDKKYDEAESLLRRAISQSPTYPSPHYNLRRLYIETKRYDDADRELWAAIDKGLRDPERTVDRAARDYEDLSLVHRAASLLNEALERYPDHEPFWVHQLVIRIRLGQCIEAGPLGAAAAGRFPNSAPVHAFYGLAAGCAGDLPTARRELRRSLEINPNQETLRKTLAEMLP